MWRYSPCLVSVQPGAGENGASMARRVGSLPSPYQSRNRFTAAATDSPRARASVTARSQVSSGMRRECILAGLARSVSFAMRKVYRHSRSEDVCLYNANYRKDMNVCVICHDPNPTSNSTCSPECATDLALATGRITDYPEETHMPDTTETTDKSCTCFTNEADCLDCRSCITHHDLDDCDDWDEWVKDGWH